VFVIQLQVSHTSRISATCGIPSSNLLTDVSKIDDSEDNKIPVYWNFTSSIKYNQSEDGDISLYWDLGGDVPKTNHSGNREIPLFWNHYEYYDYYDSNATFSINGSLFDRIIDCGVFIGFHHEFPIILIAAVVGGFIIIIAWIGVVFLIRKRRSAVLKIQQEATLIPDNTKPSILPYSFTPIDGGQKQKLVEDVTAFENA